MFAFFFVNVYFFYLKNFVLFNTKIIVYYFTNCTKKKISSIYNITYSDTNFNNLTNGTNNEMTNNNVFINQNNLTQPILNDTQVQLNNIRDWILEN